MSTVIITVVRGAIGVVSGLFFMIAHFFHATGFFFPFLYGFFGLMLFLFCGLDFTQMNTDLTLYILGAALSVICMIIWAIRYIILKPNAAYNERIAEKRRKKEMRRMRREEVGEFQSERRDYASEPRSLQTREKPRVYRSRKHPQLIVYDYSDRYELFREEDGELVYYKTEWKDEEDYD